MLCGLPGSGKSTVAAALAGRLEGAVVLDSESVTVRKDRLETLRRTLDEVAASHRYVILDGTFFRREQRDTVRMLGYPVLLAYLKCPLRVCLQRNEVRDGVADSGAVIVMHHRFQEPEIDETPVVIHSERVTADVAARLIHRAVGLVSGADAPEEEAGRPPGTSV
jgi:predicted kinase